MIKKYSLKTKGNRLLILLITIIMCLALTFYIGFIRGQEVVYTQFFYIPVILAGIWYHRKAVYVALFLGTVHIFITYISVQNVTLDNFGRFAILIVVAYFIGIISEKRAMGETKLRETRDYLESLINYATAPIIVWDPESRITRFNRAFEHLTGYTAGEVIGQELNMLFPESNRNDTLRKIESTSRGEFWESVEIPILCRDGDIRIALWNSSNINAEAGTTLIATIAQGIDITERMKAEEALIASKDYTESIIQNFLDTLIVVDAEAKIQTVNPATCDLLGYTEKELIGQPVSIIFAEEEEEEEEVYRLFQFFRKAEGVIDLHNQNTIRNRELTYRTKDSKLIPMSFNASILIDEKGNVTNVVAGAKDITDLKHAEEEIRKEKIFSENIVATVPNSLLVIDKDLKIKSANRTFYETFQTESEKVIGTRITDILGDEEGKLNTELSGLFETGGTLKNFELNYQSEKVGERVFNIIARGIIVAEEEEEEEELVVLQDITEHKRAEQIQKVLYNISNAVITTDNLEKLISLIQKELGTIIDTTNFYVALYDPKTDTLSLPFFADEKDELTTFPAGKTLTYYVIKTQKPLLGTKEKIKALEQSGEVESFGTDSEIWLGVPLKSEGNVTGVLAVQSYTDQNAYDESDIEMLEFISDQVSISIERKKAEQDLKTALEKATESDRLKSAFLATMSHELRTPLNAVIGFSQLLDSESPGEEVEEFANRIHKSGNHLLHIIEDIFDITLIEAGVIKINKEEQNIRPLLDDLLVMIKAEQEKLNKPGIDIRLNPANKNKDLYLLTDHLRLKQILINLLKNALKFADEGVVEFGYEEKTQNKQPLLQFFVKDTGIGIPKEKQTFIFDVFRQADETYTRQYGGVGIGLSVAKKLTELLGGKIWVESTEGAGTQFYFTIPVEEQETSREVKPDKKTDSKINLQGKTILVVEDSESSYQLFEVILKRVGAKTIWAKDGKDSIELCRRNPEIDLVLMDINLPLMNGYEATKQIKQIRPKLPVIAQTAYAVAGDHEKSLAAGCDDYISKPIIREMLMEKIGRLLSG